MKCAYFDCQYGAAGDMLNAALLSAGLDEAAWLKQINGIALPSGSFSLKISNVMRCGMVAKKVDVVNSDGIKFDQLYDDAVQATAASSNSEPAPGHGNVHHHQGEGHLLESEHPQDKTPRRQDMEHEHWHAPRPEPDRGRSHHVGPGHELLPRNEHQSHESAGRSTQHHREHRHEHGSGHLPEQRNLAGILKLIGDSEIAPSAKDLAGRIFKRLANAESQIHGVNCADVHFHEVGAIDAIVDIVGFAIGYCLLGIEASFCSAVAIGSGKVRTEHGLFPVPGPATAYLLSEVGAAIAPGAIPFECLTPTGAAILCEITNNWGSAPAFQQLGQVGYGAGTKDPADWPNVCRVMLGESSELAQPTGNKFAVDTVAVIQANLDDFNPQALSFCVERLFQAGALDVTVVACVMKKGRSGQVLTVLARLEDRLKLQELILTETTSIGVRWYTAQRLIADRQWVAVTLTWGGTVRMKIALDLQGKLINAQPEYDDCAAYANDHNLPLKEVLLDAMTQFRAGSTGTG